MPEAFLCHEALDPTAPALAQAGALYEATQPADERIPWEWIARSVAGRAARRPGDWCPHLILATSRATRRGAEDVVGFAHGIFLGGLGGYLAYLGVDERQRGRGVGRRLIGTLAAVFQVDSAGLGAELPFVVWESRPPPDVDPALWATRVRLFDRVGAWWLSGLTFHAPNPSDRGAPGVPLQLFLLPVATGAETFGPDELRGVAAGLFRAVYKVPQSHALYRRSLPPSCRPALRPARDALGYREAEPR
jgi:GNAT superfamily N-acetyltransferase